MVASPEEISSSTTKRKIGRYSLAAAAFIASKSAVFFAPLLLSNVLGIQEYGEFEYAVGIASMFAVLLAMGMPSAVSFFLLQKRDSSFNPAFDLHVILIGTTLLSLSIARHAFHVPQSTYLAFLIASIFAIQAISSTRHKVGSSPIRASWIESGAYIIWLLLTLAAIAFNWKVHLDLLIATTSVYAAVLVVGHRKTLLGGQPLSSTISKYRDSLRFGFPLIFTSLFMLVLANSGRVLIGNLLTVEAVGFYSFLFRICAIVVLIHQLLNTLFFRRFYESAPHKLDSYFSLILGTVTVVSFALYLITPSLLSPFFAIMQQIKGEYLVIFFALSIQMIFWIGTAQLESIVAREGLGKSMAKVLFTVATLFIVASITLSKTGVLTLTLLVHVHLAFIFTAFMSQVLLLRNHGVKLIRTPLTASAVLISYCVSKLFL